MSKPSGLERDHDLRAHAVGAEHEHRPPHPGRYPHHPAEGADLAHRERRCGSRPPATAIRRLGLVRAREVDPGGGVLAGRRHASSSARVDVREVAKGLHPRPDVSEGDGLEAAGRRTARPRRSPSRRRTTIARRMLSSRDRPAAGEIRHEPAGERVARAGGIEHLLERIGRHVEGAVGLDQQRAVLALLDHHALGSVRQDPARRRGGCSSRRTSSRASPSFTIRMSTRPQQRRAAAPSCSGSSSSSCRTRRAWAAHLAPARRAGARDRCCRGTETRADRNAAGSLGWKSANTPSRVSSVSRLWRS